MGTEPIVYVVDDEPDICALLRDVLERASLRVKTYTSSREFLLAFKPNDPGCLVLDISMPEINGLELMDNLVSQGNRTPIVFLTGTGTVATAVDALKAGAVDFIEKPPKLGALLDCVNKAMSIDLKRRFEELAASQIELRLAQLTPREREVMGWITEGKSNKMIARILNISSRTVEIHRRNIFEKMQAPSVAELVKMDLAVQTDQAGQG